MLATLSDLVGWSGYDNPKTGRAEASSLSLEVGVTWQVRDLAPGRTFPSSVSSICRIGLEYLFRPKRIQDDRGLAVVHDTYAGIDVIDQEYGGTRSLDVPARANDVAGVC